MTSTAKLSLVDCGYLITCRAMGGLYYGYNITWKQNKRPHGECVLGINIKALDIMPTQHIDLASLKAQTRELR